VHGRTGLPARTCALGYYNYIHTGGVRQSVKIDSKE